MFHFEKIKKQSAYPCKIQKKLKGPSFLVKNLYIKNIWDVVEITKNPQNPL